MKQLIFILLLCSCVSCVQTTKPPGEFKTNDEVVMKGLGVNGIIISYTPDYYWVRYVSNGNIDDIRCLPESLELRDE